MPRPSPVPAGPLHRRFDAASVRDAALSVRIDATPAEREALARDIDLPGIAALGADLVVAREGTAGLRVTGRLQGEIRRVCVVSLDDFDTVVDEALDVHFAPEGEVEALVAARAARPPADDDVTEDLPDPIVGGRIDLGALVAEILVLALDPYPRKPGIGFVEPAPHEGDATVSPFAGLGGWKGGGER